MKEVHILLVEDNEGDIFLAREALREARISNRVSIVTDGEYALDFLYKRNKYVQAEAPDLILLDINLPKINGIEVLKIIKHDEQLKSIPVIMLTTSDSEKDVLETYQNYVNCYITKPIDLNNFLNVITSIESFWLNLVQLPIKEGRS